VSRPADPAGSPELSIVSTLYRSEPYLATFYRRMAAAAEGLGASWELVLVDDGSPDLVADVARELVASDPRVVLVELSRNFGHHPAAVAGLRHARGARIFILDVDLEEQPEWLGDFVADMERTGADVVYGVNTSRGGGFFRKSTGSLFWKLFNSLSDVAVPENPCTVRLMERRYVDALRASSARTPGRSPRYCDE
jgi:putative glycosyltransferase